MMVGVASHVVFQSLFVERFNWSTCPEFLAKSEVLT